MASWVDKKYINLSSPRLTGFVWKDTNLANFRCPFCGDSDKKKSKKRGFFYQDSGTYYFYCHNQCGGKSMQNFLKEFDKNLYDEYIAELFENKYKRSAEIVVPKKEVISPRVYLPPVTLLPKNHIARRYLNDRKIPEKYHHLFSYTDNFKKCIDRVHPEHGKTSLPEDERILIPHLDANNNLIAVQGRALHSAEYSVRYITIKLSEALKVFGQDRFNRDQKTYVTEGAFDSLFLPNTLAISGGSLKGLLGIVDKHNTVFIWDNEPRNSQIVKQVKQAVKLGLTVFIWPDLVAKDLNDLIISGISEDELKILVDQNSFSGLEAELLLTKWSKI